MIRKLVGSDLVLKPSVVAAEGPSMSSWSCSPIAGSSCGITHDWDTTVVSSEQDWASDVLRMHWTDNVSKHCLEVVSTNDDNGTLRILRGVKLLLVKLAHRYDPLPLLILLFVAMLVGLLMGVVLGRWWESRKRHIHGGRRNGASSAPPLHSSDGPIPSWWSSWSYWPDTKGSFAQISPGLLCHLSFLRARAVVSAVSASAAAAFGESSISRTITPDEACGTNWTGPELDTTIHSSSALYPPVAASTTHDHQPDTSGVHVETLEQREERTRLELLRGLNQVSERESGVDRDLLPKHIAIIMDGNRRYGKARYGDIARGHWDGSRKLLEVAKWCELEGIQYLTVYAFSTENWSRAKPEVDALMAIFVRYCDELRKEATERNIRVRVLSTETAQIPADVQEGLRKLEYDTKDCVGGLNLNVCLSYGSRGEIVHACRHLAMECARGHMKPDEITEISFADQLLTAPCPDPDILIRTSGEVRVSNFLLWQAAYTEMFFVDKNWPELERHDLICIIQKYAKGRERRYGR